MHEISIMQSTLQLAREQMEKSGCTEIQWIKLRIGLMSGVVPEALAFSFDVLKAGTPAANATLEIERMPGLFHCSGCGLEERRDSIEFQCAGCGGLLQLVEGGAELELAQMKIS